MTLGEIFCKDNSCYLSKTWSIWASRVPWFPNHPVVVWADFPCICRLSDETEERTRAKRSNLPQTVRCWRKRCDSPDPCFCPCMPVSLSGLEASWKWRLFHGRSWEEAEACRAAAAAAVGSTCRTSASSDRVASGLIQHSSPPLIRCWLLSLTHVWMHAHTRTHTHTHSHIKGAHAVAELRTPQWRSTRRQNIPIMPPQFRSGFLFVFCLCVSECGWRWVRNTERERDTREKERGGVNKWKGEGIWEAELKGGGKCHGELQGLATSGSFIKFLLIMCAEVLHSVIFPYFYKNWFPTLYPPGISAMKTTADVFVTCRSACAPVSLFPSHPWHLHRALLVRWDPFSEFCYKTAHLLSAQYFQLLGALFFLCGKTIPSACPPLVCLIFSQLFIHLS